MHSHNTTVTVEPGKTTVVNLGDSGALIRGRARVGTITNADNEPLTISGNLNTKMERMPSFGTPAEYRAYQQTPEYKARMAQHKYFGVLVNPDGSFQVDSVPSGEYTLMLNAFKTGSSPFGGMNADASQNVSVTVPDNPDPSSPIDLGEIVLLARPQRATTGPFLNR